MVIHQRNNVTNTLNKIHINLILEEEVLHFNNQIMICKANYHKI
jgi:hypothetical protein